MRPEAIDSIPALRARLDPVRRRGERIGFVPTMGALHAGHGSLIDRARDECNQVVVSIFVNPLQFDRPDDLARYPRSLDADLDMCARLGVAVVFVPQGDEMYPVPPRCTVEVAELGDHLCGRYRPGHFRGVATVVLKLFEIVRPDAAYFGEKDAQQLAIIRRLVDDFNIPLSIVGVPTVREADGLAMSSRNARLDAAERQLALSLYGALREAESAIAAGVRSSAAVRERASGAIRADPRIRLEYLEVVDPATMQPVDDISGEVIVAGALWVGSTRLIDNVRSTPPVQS